MSQRLYRTTAWIFTSQSLSIVIASFRLARRGTLCRIKIFIYLPACLLPSAFLSALPPVYSFFCFISSYQLLSALLFNMGSIQFVYTEPLHSNNGDSEQAPRGYTHSAHKKYMKGKITIETRQTQYSAYTMMYSCDQMNHSFYQRAGMVTHTKSTI